MRSSSCCSRTSCCGPTTAACAAECSMPIACIALSIAWLKSVVQNNSSASPPRFHVRSLHTESLRACCSTVLPHRLADRRCLRSRPISLSGRLEVLSQPAPATLQTCAHDVVSCGMVIYSTSAEAARRLTTHNDASMPNHAICSSACSCTGSQSAGQQTCTRTIKRFSKVAVGHLGGDGGVRHVAGQADGGRDAAEADGDGEEPRLLHDHLARLQTAKMPRK